MNQGFIRRTFAKYFEQNFLLGAVAQCPITKDDIPESKKPLDLISVFGVLMLFCIGMFGAAVSFLVEFWVFRKAQKALSKNETNIVSKFKKNIKIHYINVPINNNNPVEMIDDEKITAAAREEEDENVTFRQTWPFSKTRELSNNNKLKFLDKYRSLKFFSK